MKTSRNLNLTVTYLPLADLKTDPRNARLHSAKQIAMLAKTMGSLGFNNPILIDHANTIIAGYARLEAAKKLGLVSVPTIRLEHLTPEQVRAYRIADNRLAELAQWDEPTLRLELQELSFMTLDFDLTVTGFEMPEIDFMLMAKEEKPEIIEPFIQPKGPGVVKPGDLWTLGSHRVLCGNSLTPHSYDQLLIGEAATMVFTDPPYNVPVSGHILTQNVHNHSEFAMASGEMNDAEFEQFLGNIIHLLKGHTTNGSIHYICMDWRHIYHLLSAGKIYDELKNICIWNKKNGGMGSLYRSKHEMIAVFKNGKQPHINNVGLGKYGRNRTNVWDYAGQTSPHANRDEELAMHPTVKPVEMIEQAIYDCSNRHDIILDPFGGSGSTLIACENAGRKARLIEIDPLYIDVTIRRWQSLTGQQAVLSHTGETFDAVKARLEQGYDG